MAIAQTQAPITPPTAAVTTALPQAAPPPTAAQMYEAQTAMRRELLRQHDRLTTDRLSIAQRLRDGERVTGADRNGLETRLADLDARIVDMQKQIASADAAVAQAASVPGAVVTPPRTTPNGPPEEVVVLGVIFMIFVAFPIAIAFARRIWTRGRIDTNPQLSNEVNERLTRLEHAVDSVAVEVERIGEGQRFVTNLFIESGAPLALGTGAVESIAAHQAQGAPVEARSTPR